MSADSSGPAWRLKDLSSAQYSRLSELLDACLALPPEARTEWLSRLESEDLRTAEILRKLLAQSNASGVSALLLETDEILTRHLASLAIAEDAFVGRHVGPYRVLSLLGQGGMGSVWLAERADGLFTRRVALKLIHTTLMANRGRERLAREREILASLDHPNIARLLDAGFSDEGQPYLALQYVEGEPITIYCDGRRLNVRERLQLFLQVLGAVQYAHAHLVIHRDLKPSNMLVTTEGKVQLLDFGIAKLLTAEMAHETALTQLGGRALTPDYAAPEQILGAPVTTATDVYALGVILYELLTGQRPYRLKRDSRGAIEEAVLNLDATAPSQMVAAHDCATGRSMTSRTLRKTLMGDLDTIILKALKKQPDQRYATAEAFLEDITRYLRGDTVLARPDNLWYRLRKFSVRNRVALGVIGLICVSLAVGLGIAIFKAQEANVERARAERIKEFIASIFDAASPYVGGKKLTARDVLDIGAKRVERELRGDPAVSAELWALLASSYLDLGELDLALSTARRAQQMSDELPDENDPLRGRVLQVLARVTYDKGRVAEAQDLLRRAVAIQRRAGPRHAADLARSLSLLSDVATDQDRIDESVSLARESVDLMLRARGPRDPLTIELTGELSNRLLFVPRADEALSYARQAYEAAVETFGDPSHPAVVRQLTNLAYGLDATGQLAAAKEQWERVVDADRKTYVPDSPQLGQALYGLARAHERLGELKQAVQYYTDALDIYRKQEVTAGGELATHYFAAGRAALSARRSESAVQSLTEAVSLGLRAMGENADRVHDGQNFLAVALIYAGKLDQAQQLLDQRITQDRSQPEAYLSTLLTYRSLLQLARGNVAASLEASREAWASLVTKTPARESEVLSSLGRAQLEAHDFEAASQALEKSLTLLRQMEPVPTPRQVDVWVAIARVRLEQHRVEEAIQWTRAAAEYWDHFDSENVFCGEAHFWYARALRARGSAALARQQMLLAGNLLKNAPWPAHRHLASEARGEPVMLAQP